LLLPGGEPPSSLRRLGDLTVAPIYLGIPVRAGGPLPGDSIFDRAMAAYRDEYYGQAVVALRAALDAGVEAAPAEFFLAASQLMTGRPEPAAVGFGRVIALGATPYLAEAHYYRAKALLRLGRTPEALRDLELASTNAGATGAAARALADSVKERQPR
jgi:tetratricopeptide (TPR) repeat protein